MIYNDLTGIKKRTMSIQKMVNKSKLSPSGATTMDDINQLKDILGKYIDDKEAPIEAQMGKLLEIANEMNKNAQESSLEMSESEMQNELKILEEIALEVIETKEKEKIDDKDQKSTEKIISEMLYDEDETILADLLEHNDDEKEEEKFTKEDIDNSLSDDVMYDNSDGNEQDNESDNDLI